MSDQPGLRSDAERDRRSVEERRAQLVQAATEVISRDGLGRATTRRITDHADLALGAFHYAFRSKEELLGAVIERFGQELDELLRGTVSDPSAGLDDVVDQLTNGIWSIVDDSPALQLARYELVIHALRTPRLQPVVEEQHEHHVRTVIDVFTASKPDLDPAEADELARFFLATIDGLILQWLTHGDGGSPEQRIALSLRCIRAVLSDAS